MWTRRLPFSPKSDVNRLVRCDCVEIVRFILACRLMNVKSLESLSIISYTKAYTHKRTPTPSSIWKWKSQQPIVWCRMAMIQCWKITFHEIKCSRCYLKLKITNQGHLILFILQCFEFQSIAINRTQHSDEYWKREYFKGIIRRFFYAFFHGLWILVVKREDPI